MMALCSGQFAFTNSPIPSSAYGLSELERLIDISENIESQVPKEVLPESPEVLKKQLKNLLESTDEEKEVEEVEPLRTKKLKKRRQKLVNKLNISDDEDEEEEEESVALEEEDIVETPEDVLIEYDSEENEIEVKITKKVRNKLASEYFEKEAELSESDWGSADENEKGMDKYDIELADEEQFDQTQLREEIGRIHAKKVMDEDIKNVKKLQDMLFEDEENDGVGRERKFRWKNQDEGFSVIDENARDADNQGGLENEEESEILWRRMRHERDVLVNTQSQHLEGEEDILLLDQNSQTVTSTSTSTLVKRKFQIIKNSSSSLHGSATDKTDSPFLIKNNKKFINNSFLSRDEQTLSKIASFISNKHDDEVTNMSSHGGNSMSFLSIDKTTEDNKKRKSDENCKNQNNKRRKVESQNFLLDQLKN